MRSSLGHHTITIFQRLTYSEAMDIKRALDYYDEVRVRPSKSKGSYGYPNKYFGEYLCKDKGIRWELRFNDELSGIIQPSIDSRSLSYQREPKTCSIKATINPKVFIGIKDYLTAASAEHIEELETQFNMEAARIAPVFGTFNHYFLNRTDYCFNFDPVELLMGCTAKRLLELIKRGDIPKHFNLAMKYDERSRKMKPHKNDFRLWNKSVTASCYHKYAQLVDRFLGCPDLEYARNIIRFEIKYKYPKMYAMSRSIKELLKMELSFKDLMEEVKCGGVVNPTKNLLSDDFAAGVIQQYFDKIIRKGDYFSLKGAEWMVKSHNFRRDKEERLFFALEVVNKYRGIAKAKAKLSGVDLTDFKRSLKDLDAIYVNPVTIPRDWDIPHISNPLRAYYKGIYTEQMITKKEFSFECLLAEYLSGQNS